MLLAGAAIRLVSLGEYPLADTTEARYGEIARVMADGGDWITPRLEPDVPFWGKPPLSIWLTAAAFSAFGVSEFWARLPTFLLILACAWMLVHLGSNVRDKATGLAAAAIFLTTGLGFVAAGTVMTDPALVFTTTLAMVSFWRAVIGLDRRWGYVFFVALGLGLLAKGPVAWVLSLAPIGVWAFWHGRWRQLMQILPWRSGLALMLAIAVPWYVAAELRTPGFLDYFLIGEHWLRFVDSGWDGDLYGSAHAQPRGMIWLFWFGSAMPWSIVAIFFAVRWLRHRTVQTISEWNLYLILWATVPMLFFSFAGNILPAYVLPGLPALGLLLAQPLAAQKSRMLHVGWVIPALFLVMAPTVIFDRVKENSQCTLMQRVSNMGQAHRVIYLYSRPYSAMFYSAGKARRAATVEEAIRLLDQPGLDFLAVGIHRMNDIPASLRERLDLVEEFQKYVLLIESRQIGDSFQASNLHQISAIE